MNELYFLAGKYTEKYFELTYYEKIIGYILTGLFILIIIIVIIKDYIEEKEIRRRRNGRR